MDALIYIVVMALIVIGVVVGILARARRRYRNLDRRRWEKAAGASDS